VIPPEATGEFVWRMEDILEVYTRPSDPKRPLVCLDEMPEQLLADVRAPIPMRAGQPVREDSEYDRRGMVNIFLGCEPRAGRRWVAVTDRRTKVDWAHPSKDLVDVRSPAADRIVLVLDNLNTHTPASLSAAFAPAAAKRLADMLQIHYPQARQLAEQRRDRTPPAQSPVPGPADPRQGDAPGRSHRLGRAPQRRGREG